MKATQAGVDLLVLNKRWVGRVRIGWDMFWKMMSDGIEKGEPVDRCIQKVTWLKWRVRKIIFAAAFWKDMKSKLFVKTGVKNDANIVMGHDENLSNIFSQVDGSRAKALPSRNAMQKESVIFKHNLDARA